MKRITLKLFFILLLILVAFVSAKKTKKVKKNKNAEKSLEVKILEKVENCKSKSKKGDSLVM